MLVAGIAKVGVGGERGRPIATATPAREEVATDDAIGELGGEVVEVDLGSSGGGGDGEGGVRRREGGEGYGAEESVERDNGDDGGEGSSE